MEKKWKQIEKVSFTKFYDKSALDLLKPEYIKISILNFPTIYFLAVVFVIMI